MLACFGYGERCAHAALEVIEWGKGIVTKAPALPRVANWDITYACPLRCIHCYSESGRRPSKQLSTTDLLRVVDALLAARVQFVNFSGGEPLLVKGFFDVAEHLRAGGVCLSMHTSGHTLGPDDVPLIHRLFHNVSVSLDGASSAVHDRIRGFRGSFDRSIRALSLLVEHARAAHVSGERCAKIAIDMTVIQSNLCEVEALCADVAPRFPGLSCVRIGACVPSGLGSREGFAAQELLSPEALRSLMDPARAARLAASVPPGCSVQVPDVMQLRMGPDDACDGNCVQIEPNGAVRAMLIYEGTVGNLLEEPLEVLWPRALARRDDPLVKQALVNAHTMVDWAAGVRRLDMHFGDPEDRARISRRPDRL